MVFYRRVISILAVEISVYLCFVYVVAPFKFILSLFDMCDKILSNTKQTFILSSSNNHDINKNLRLLKRSLLTPLPLLHKKMLILVCSNRLREALCGLLHCEEGKVIGSYYKAVSREAFERGHAR